MKNPPHDLLICPYNEHTNILLSYVKVEKKSISNSRIWTYRENAGRLTKLIIKNLPVILCKEHGVRENRPKKKKKKISKKRNGLPPAGLADLDPWLREQTKEQAKSGLKDNTIQKVSMQTHVFVHKHISKIAIFSTSCSYYSIFVLMFIISYMSHYLAFIYQL